jgi:hypothetical protein
MGGWVVVTRGFQCVLCGVCVCVCVSERVSECVCVRARVDEARNGALFGAHK